MAANSVSIRLGVEGQADLKRVFDDVAKSGDAAFQTVGKGMEQAGQAADRQTAKFQKWAQAARDAEAAGRAQSNINALLGVNSSPSKSASDSASVFETALSAAEKLEARTKALRSAIDPVSAAQDRMNASVKNADELLAAGTITISEHASAIGLARRNYDAFAQGAKGANDNIAKSGGLAAYQLTNLRSQAFDVFTSLQGGISPFTVLSQQGPQVYEALAGGRGIAGGMKAAGQSAAGLLSRITPMALSIGGLISVVAAAGVATIAFSQQQEALERSLNGVGRAAGVSLDGLRAIGVSGARQGGFSSGQGIELAGQFAAAGLDARVMPGLIASSQRYSRAFGLDLSDAGSELARAFGDPTKGLDELEKRLGPFSDATRENVRRLQAQGDLEGARGAAFDAYNAKLKEAADRTGFWTRLWDGAKGAASNAGQAVGGFFAPSLQQQIDTFEGRRDALQRTMRRGSANGALGADDQELLEEYNRRIADLRLQLQKEDTDAKRRADQDEALRRSQDLGRTVRSMYPEIGQRQALEDRYKDLQKSLIDPEVLKATTLSAEDAKRALDGTKFALDNFETPLKRIATDSTLATAQIIARTFAEREAVAVEQARVSAIRAGGDALTTAAEQESARAKMVAESSRKADDLLRSSRDNLELVKLNPFERAMREIDFKYRDFREQNIPGTDAVTVGFTRVSSSATKLAEVLAGVTARIAGEGSKSLPVFAGGLGGGDVEAYVRQAALARGIDPDVAARVISKESSFNPYARNISSREASYGVMQLNTMGGLGAVALREGIDVRDPTQWRRQVDFGMDVVARDGWRQWYGARDVGISRWQGIGGAVGEKTDAAEGKDRAARVYELATKPYKDASDDIERQTKLLEVQASTFGRSTEEVARATRQQELVNEATRQGTIDLAGVREGIDATAQQWGEYARKLEETQEHQRMVVESLDAVRSGTKGALSTFVSDLQNGKKGADALNDALKRIFDTLQSRVMDSLVDGLFGKSGKSNGGLFGGGLSSLFNGGSIEMPNWLSGLLDFNPLAFANGGIMTNRGRVPLNAYANGGIADSPQFALFGEGRMPEAYVPLPDGKRIPVAMNMPRAPSAQPAAVQRGRDEVHYHDYSGAGVRQKTTQKSDGGRRTDVMIGEAFAAGARSPQGQSALRGFGVRQPVVQA